jgi:ankyrin repeat protein
MSDQTPAQARLRTKEKALLKAAQAGDTEKVRELIDKGADVNCGDTVGWDSNITPLMYAAEAGHLEIVNLLLNAGADVHARNKSREMSGGEATALHHALQLYAAGKPRIEVVEALLKAGADPNARLANTDTALDMASQKEFEDAVALMLRFGGDHNASLGIGRRPALSGAASQANISLVRQFLSAGADPNGQSIHGATPLMAAAACQVVAEKDYDAGATLEILRLLLKAGARVNQVTKKGRTALMIACEQAARAITKEEFRDIFPAVKFLVEKAKADINQKDSTGQTALDYASIGDHQELVAFLRKHGGKLASQL